MCGLWGYDSDGFDLRRSDRKTLSKIMGQLGELNLDRGKDSHGWVYKRDGAWDRGRKVGKFSLNTYNIASKSDIGLFHTRFATCGNKDLVKAAHPFKVGKDDYGMHNGMVFYSPDLNKHLVDSMSIIKSLYYGDKESLKETDAYGTVLWTKNGLVNIFRFNNGEFSIAKTELGFIWTSDKEDLYKVINRFLPRSSVMMYKELDENKIHYIKDKELYYDTEEIPTSLGKKWWMKDYSGMYGGCNDNLYLTTDVNYSISNKKVECYTCGETGISGELCQWCLSLLD